MKAGRRTEKDLFGWAGDLRGWLAALGRGPRGSRAVGIVIRLSTLCVANQDAADRNHRPDSFAEKTRMGVGVRLLNVLVIWEEVGERSG